MVVWKDLSDSFLHLVPCWMLPFPMIANGSFGRNIRDCICILSLCLKKVLCGSCSKYEELSYICNLEKNMVY